MFNSNENQNSSPEVLAAQTEGTATEATTAVLDDSTGQETSENDAGNISNDEVMSNNEDDRRVGFSSSTSSSKDLVNEQEGITELKKGKGKRSASERLQRSKQQLKEKDEEIIALKAQQNTQEVANLQQQLQAKDDEIKDLQEQLNNRPIAAQLQAKDEEITQLKAQVQQLQAKNAEVVELNKQLEESKSLVDKLQKEKQTLEDKSKTTEQPKQGNGAKYTATVGVGLAAGLIAFTALEHTVRLEMLVIIGIAVTSALVAGGITYAVLPSTQVDGAKEQEVNEMGKRSNKG